MSDRVPVTLARWDYDRTAALASGEVPFIAISRTRQLMGADYWPYGLAGNEAGLAAFLRYSHSQGLAHRLLDPAGLFAPETLESYVI